jgi:integrase
MLQLDAGLRLGEAFELRWGAVFWGEDTDDTSRRIQVVEARARGKFSGTPKSGRSRTVAMSRRLRRLLLERHIQLGRPAADVPPKILRISD